jgi:hypothetical protein
MNADAEKAADALGVLMAEKPQALGASDSTTTQAGNHVIARWNGPAATGNCFLATPDTVSARYAGGETSTDRGWRLYGPEVAMKAGALSQRA